MLTTSWLDKELEMKVKLPVTEEVITCNKLIINSAQIFSHSSVPGMEVTPSGHGKKNKRERKQNLLLKKKKQSHCPPVV